MSVAVSLPVAQALANGGASHGRTRVEAKP